MDIELVKKNLNERGYISSFFQSASEAVAHVLTLIPEGATVGFGGSQTVKQIGLPEALAADGRKLLLRGTTQGMTNEEIMRAGVFADWFVASANAVTEDGELVNIDGTGNRVASLIYGPKNVVCLVGVNKIVPDLSAAIKRARDTAARLNVLRFGRTAPCTEGGSCEDCKAGTSICNVTTIQHHPTLGKNYHVILINEKLGF